MTWSCWGVPWCVGFEGYPFLVALKVNHKENQLSVFVFVVLGVEP